MDRLDFDTLPPVVGDNRSRRVKARDSLFLSARLRIEGEPGEREVRVRNLSEQGLMLDLGRVVALGTALALHLRGIGEVSGRVAWCAEGRVGVALDTAVDPQRARRPVTGGTGTPLYAKPQLR